MTGRVYLGEVLNQVWLKSIELLDKPVNAQKENFQGLRKLPQAHEKVCDETNKETRKKRRARKNIIDGRRAFIGYL